MASNSAPKDPHAVALGRKRQAGKTPAERAEFARIGSAAAREANARRSPVERRMIAMKAARTRRLAPAWLRRLEQRNAAKQAVSVSSTPAPIAEQAAELEQLIEQLDDETLWQLAARINAPSSDRSQ